MSLSEKKTHTVARLSVGVALMATSAPAHASGWDNCFDDGTQVALCNGVIAGLGGLLGTGGMGYSLLSSEPVEAGWVAGGVALGIYAGVSGGVLVALHETMAPDDPLRATSLGLGIADLALGGASLALSAAAGIRSAFEGDDDDDDEEDDGWVVVPEAPRAAVGLSFQGHF